MFTNLFPGFFPARPRAVGEKPGNEVVVFSATKINLTQFLPGKIQRALLALTGIQKNRPNVGQVIMSLRNKLPSASSGSVVCS